jgi:DNA primase
VDSPEYKNAMYYLKKRGLTRDDIVRYNIGYCEKGEYDGHVIVPSYDADGKLNFFMGRRYYNVERVIPHKKPEVPMNLIGFECFVNYSEPLNLVEGVFDAIAVRVNAIPLFGKYMSAKLKEAIVLNNVKQGPC